MERAWYAVEAKPHKAPLVVANLQQEGIDYYQPRLEVPGRRRKRVVPLFPGYLFARIGNVSDSVRVRYTPGVKGIVGGTEMPMPIDDEVIDSIRAREESDGIIHPGGVFDFRPQQRAKVRGGSLDGLEVLFQGYLPDGQRVEILLEILGRQVRTVVSVDRLMPTTV
jgi:transcriptional antiterminator RfaH